MLTTPVDAGIEKKSNHQAKVVRITDIQKHPNADTLGLAFIGGYQVVVKLEEFKPGDLAVYIQPDSVVPQTEPFRFIWEPYLAEGVTEVPERKRRITVRRFRKEWSEGLLLPVSVFTTLRHPANLPQEGDDVSDLLGITHWAPPEPEERPKCGQPQVPKRGWKRYLYLIRNAIYSWLGIKQQGVLRDTGEKAPSYNPPVYDVEAYKNHVGAFQPGEMVIVTEKIHGSNARFTWDGHKMHVGSRQMWKSPRLDNTWHQALAQNPAIEQWCRAHPGATLYGEVVPTQGPKFTYGCKARPGQVQFFLFDVLEPTGEWRDGSHTILHTVTENQQVRRTYLAEGLGSSGIEYVPVLYIGPFDEAKIKEMVDGKSLVAGASHLREGVVIKPCVERQVRGLGRLQLKLVSNEFLEKDK